MYYTTMCVFKMKCKKPKHSDLQILALTSPHSYVFHLVVASHTLDLFTHDMPINLLLNSIFVLLRRKKLANYPIALIYY
jgi:hypothetical protein